MGLLKARSGSAIPAAADAAEEPRLDHPDPMLRRRAVQALHGDPESVSVLVALLREEGDNLVRQAAFLALASLNSEKAAHGVAVMLSDADAALRNGALETLASMPTHAGGLLEPLGRDEDPDVRIFAVLLAGELQDSAAGAWLLSLAASETDPNVCSNLAEALGGTGLPDAVPALEAIAARFPDEPFLAFAVETALQRLHEA
ncbi:HEAT repeat domain-containing protein [Novosphingobium olei]|uniref:HEAT repeat domain-containing protein n=1 Tax=Novosphingobium olei TaxID=2728851 RepID=A0A7Y0BND1_9SPHN|nr:HEAT repeat domain-containing protein [Novosphingobium olei]NML93529.1 HEAT repeat domain-containing protein [Novosphingobium olei]BEV00188.1 HEAT repeat domain-containing protein [Novosphingobium olei]